MNKKNLLMLLCLIASLSFFGCSNITDSKNIDTADNTKSEKDSSNQQSKGGTVNLTFWCDEDEIELFQEMINSFIETYKNEANINVTCEVNGASGCKDALLADLDNAADVFSIPDDQLLTLVAAGILEPVNNGTDIAERNLEGAVEAASVDNVVYAYPITADNGYFLYYDKKYLTEDDVKTVDRILEVCEKNKKQFVMDWSSGWYLYSFFGNTGMQVGLNEDGLTNFCDWNSTENSIKGVDVAESMLRIAASSGFKSSGDFPKEAKKKAIAIVSGVWDINSIKAAYGEDYGASKLPTYTCAEQQIQLSSYTGYRLLGVNSYSSHREWAERLADYLTNEDSQNLRFERADRGPSNKNAASSEAVAEVPAIKAVIAQSEFGSLQKIGQKYWTPTTEFGNTMAEGNPNNQPLQDLLDKMVSAITE